MESISKLVLAFVVLIVGMALVGQIAASGQDVTTLKSQTDTVAVNTAYAGSLTTLGVNSTPKFTVLTTYPYLTSWKNDYSECQTTTIVLKNISGATYTVTTDYVYTALNNTLYLKNTSNTYYGGNTTYATYNYCPDTYLSQGWSRSALNLVPGLFAIALLGVAVGLFYSMGKDAGIL